MPHPYPPHDPRLPYTGRQAYFLTFRAAGSSRPFTSQTLVGLVLAQFRRALVERQFELTAYCFMPDHVHLLVSGLSDRSDCRAFIAAAKQYSGYYVRRATRTALWQRYGYERVIRDEVERALTIGYIAANPVRAGLVEAAEDYPFTGSDRYTVGEMLLLAGGPAAFR
jgi:putative transposase